MAKAVIAWSKIILDKDVSCSRRMVYSEAWLSPNSRPAFNAQKRDIDWFSRLRDVPKRSLQDEAQGRSSSSADQRSVTKSERHASMAIADDADGERW